MIYPEQSLDQERFGSRGKLQDYDMQAKLEEDEDENSMACRENLDLEKRRRPKLACY